MSLMSRISRLLHKLDCGRRRTDSATAEAPNSPALVSHLTEQTTSLRTMMCRFVDGKLERQLMPVKDTRYLTISHVWGLDVGWREIPGIEGTVLASGEKADFISEKLGPLVGNDYFWMDILCVDQRDKAARIAVTQNIPTIFRFSQRTIVLRDGKSLRPCCIETIGSLENWMEKGDDSYNDLWIHYNDKHGEDFVEGVLSRLWLLQEIILSDNIQFVSCETSHALKPKRRFSSDPVWGMRISLHMMSYAWAVYGDSDRQYNKNLIHIKFQYAFLTCSSISRPNTVARRYVPLIPADHEFMLHMSSTRTTSKSRDFILAIMPQYAGYKVPDNAKSMTFAQLFVDCYLQLQAAFTALGRFRMRITPLIADFTPPGPYVPTENIPEPSNLGDFARLLGGPQLIRTGSFPVFPVQQVTTITDVTELNAVTYIHDTFRHSRHLWDVARQNDFTLPPQESIETNGTEGKSEFHRALELLWFMLYGGEKEVGAETLAGVVENTGKEVVLRTAALITCGLGISAYEWCEQHMTPVLVHFANEVCLALVPNSVVANNRKIMFTMVPAERYYQDGYYSTLLAINIETGIAMTCLFPTEVGLIDDISTAR
jgi:hypothetical protein